MELYDKEERESIICVVMGSKNPSLVTTVCHHLASLMMSNCDPWDRFFYPTLTLMIDSYNINLFDQRLYDAAYG